MSKVGLAYEMFPDYQRIFPAVFTSTSVNTSGMEVARFRVAIEAEATILVGGGSGTERTAYVALAARRMVIPIASFGGAASAVLSELRAQRTAAGGLPRSLSPDVLSQGWSPELGRRIEGWLEDAALRRDVFVVYGRNLDARDAVFSFLRSLGLNPLNWGVLVQGTGKPAPFIGEVLDHGFARAQVCLVLFTGDELVQLRPAFAGPDEIRVTIQPRPNVLFEAGMALAIHPDRTLIVRVGRTRGLSDLAGRHFEQLDDSEASRRAVARGLETAGCAVRLDGDWRTAGDFTRAIQAAGPDSPPSLGEPG